MEHPPARRQLGAAVMSRCPAEGVAIETDVAEQPALAAVLDACERALGGPMGWDLVAAGPFDAWEAPGALTSVVGRVGRRGGPLSRLSLVVVDVLPATPTSSRFRIQVSDLALAGDRLTARMRNRAALEAVLALVEHPLTAVTWRTPERRERRPRYRVTPRAS